MHPSISRILRAAVYPDNEYLDAIGLAKRPSPTNEILQNWGPSLVIPVEGWDDFGAEAALDPEHINSHSFRNQAEIEVILEFLHVAFYQAQPLLTVAVVCFYRAQALHLQKELEEAAVKGPILLPDHLSQIEWVLCTRQASDSRVTTVDKYQGQEADVVVVATTRTEGSQFVDGGARANVALSRARFCRVVVGHPIPLSQWDLFKSLHRNSHGDFGESMATRHLKASLVLPLVTS